GEKDIVVMINGIPWTATYLSHNTTGDPILTLWQADSISLNYFNVKKNAMDTGVNIGWNPTNNNNNINEYPSNLYGTSAIATAVLNNGGKFARSNTATEDMSQHKESTYAKFTMTKAQEIAGSLTEFIEIPNNTPYQKDNEKESAKKQALHPSFAYDANNDCLGAPIIENMYDYKTANSPRIYYTNTTVNPDAYLSWGDDRLWLPSIAEVGYGGDTNGLWKTSGEQRATSKTTNYLWLRSASFNYYYYSYVLSAAGDAMNNGRVDGGLNTYAIRPAFHLNLNKVSQSIGLEMPTIKGDANKYNDSADTTFELDRINENLVNIKITATGINGAEINDIPSYSVSNGVLSFTPTEVGTYTVKVTQNTEYCWSDGSANPKTYTYYLKCKVDELGISGSPAEYDGKDKPFTLSNYDAEKIKIDTTGATDWSFDGSGSSAIIKATNVKEYTVYYELTNTALLEWKSGGTSRKYISFEITKKKVTKPTLSDNPPSKPYTGSPVNFP
ncbi:MAG: hypothetical protein K2K24_05245, partial [Clostridia bacterium]|nr:hypothetical protein [Clostridia bacterium]